MKKPKIAIIGAGISSLVVAKALQPHAEVILYEKSRGVGGRMSTRQAEPYYFDHGAPYFTARSKAFNSILSPYKEYGMIKEWSGKVINLENTKKTAKRIWYEPHWVACPNMNSLCKSLSDGLDIRASIEIAPPSRSERGWKLQSTTGIDCDEADIVISTAPPAQTLVLFASSLPKDNPLSSCRMKSVYTLMLGFDKPWWENWIAAKLSDNPIEWLYINSTKPDRDKKLTSIVAHSHSRWADEHMDMLSDDVQHLLLQACEMATGIAVSKASYVTMHRWKYATIDASQQSGAYILPDIGFACTGDWCNSPSIEDVWLGSQSLADQLITLL